MMRLTAVGTSGSFPGPASAASCYLLQWEEAGDPRAYSVVLDLGSGALGPLQTHLDPDRIDAVVLSHLHPDHCFDVAGLYVHRIYSPWAVAAEAAGPGRPRLDVWAPPGAEARLTNAYHTDPGRSPRAAEAHPTDLSGAFSFRTMQEGESFTVGSTLFTPFLVDHPVECYALRIVGPEGETIAYSGDTDACEGLVTAARDTDLFLCEAAFQEERDTVRGVHLTGLRAGEAAARAHTRRLALTHIPPWTEEDVVLAEAGTRYSGPIDIAHPGTTWTVFAGQGGPGSGGMTGP